MTDREVEEIIRSNMNLQMNLAGIRADFEEKLQRTWVGLTDIDYAGLPLEQVGLVRWAEAKLKEKNT
jgi:hypothetical protein